MNRFDAKSLAEQAVLTGLIPRDQAREALAEAGDNSAEGLGRTLLRKGLLTSWQLERLQKGETTGFFYGSYRVLFHIAEGSFARVYRGRREPGDQSVAIKILRKRFQNDPEAVERFSQEAAAGKRLVHPGIVRVLDHGVQDDSHYMVLEYVEGSNLRDFLKIRQRIAPEQAVPMMLGLAEALAYSLAQGVTHRDLKGTNVLISNRGEAKLIDFGLAMIESNDRKAGPAHDARTVDYASLERTCGSAKGDPRSDIFFLGCVFYQMLTGQPPLPEVEAADPLQKMLKRSFSAIKPISTHPSAPPERLAAVIEKMMKVDLKQRFQSMDEVVTALRSYQASLTLPSPAPSSGRPQPAWVDHVEEDDDFPADLFETDSPAQPTRDVLCVEVQESIQEAFRKLFVEMGYRVRLVRDAERAVELYRESPPDLLVFDADGLGSEALGAFNAIHAKAHHRHKELTALVLLGPKQIKLRERLPTDDRLIVLTKPIKMRHVQDALSQLVPSR